MASVESISLTYQDEKSDKFYEIAINGDGVVGADGKYTVDFRYGRTGTDGQTGTKTKEPVSYDEAKAAYDKVVKSKMKKGYTEE